VIAETVLRCMPERRARLAREIGCCLRIKFRTIRRLMSRAVSLRATLKLFKSILRTVKPRCLICSEHELYRKVLQVQQKNFRGFSNYSFAIVCAAFTPPDYIVQVTNLMLDFWAGLMQYFSNITGDDK
jgi:hypothetical protein